MFRSFLKIATRNLVRQKGYSFLNIFGLALGIACGLLLTLHIREELSYEKAFQNHDRIYRVVTTEWSKSYPPLAGEMQKYFSEIESTARMADAGMNVVNSDPEHKFQCRGFFADSSLIGVFGLKPVVGDPVQSLSVVGGIVITRSMSEKFFGKTDPIGKKLAFDGKDTSFVKAVIEDLPVNSHIKFDYLISMPTFYKFVPAEWTSSRTWMFGWTYVLFKNNGDLDKTKARMLDFWLQFRGPQANREEAITEAKGVRFQPITDIHLKSNLIQEMGPNSNIIYIYIFFAVEILILIIACINFINLFTTQALKRLKEVSIRKILGAKKTQLVFQFLGEAFILTVLAGIIALVLFSIALPFYNKIAGKQIALIDVLNPTNLGIILGMIVFTGLLSGLFPALFISKFEPASSLKANQIPRSTASVFRKSLVVAQFVVAGFLIISTVLIYQQMKLFRDAQLGFDKEQIAIVNMYGTFRDKILSKGDVVKNELSTNPDIIAIGKSSNLIGDDLSVESVIPVNNGQEREYPTVRVFRIDENYLNVLNIKLKEGRNFSREFNDSASFIINEKAAEILGLKNPLGATVMNSTRNLQGKVVGIIKDFHFTSLHNQIEPLVLEYNPGWTGNLLVKIKPGKTASVISFLQAKVEKIAPGTFFSYSFLDDRIAGLYSKEDNMSQVLKAFTILSIIISCLGLFGLVAHATEVRTREIGIRKVIGASVGNLVRLLSKDFMALVIIGNLIAWPIAWYAVNKWLNSFSYRIHIAWSVFALSGLLILIVAMLTIAFHCIKTAMANPIKSLRTE